MKFARRSALFAVALSCALFFLAGFLISTGSAETITGMVSYVLDGDSFFLLSGSRKLEIRVFGIDCPEAGQPFGERARRRTMDLIARRTVAIETRDRDEYGRIVANIAIPDGRDLGRILVEEGLAWWFRRYAPERKDLNRLETAARKKRVGLWAEPDPVPPWLWRRRQP